MIKKINKNQESKLVIYPKIEINIAKVDEDGEYFNIFYISSYIPIIRDGEMYLGFIKTEWESKRNKFTIYELGDILDKFETQVSDMMMGGVITKESEYITFYLIEDE